MFVDHHQDTNEDPKGMSLSGIKVLAHFLLMEVHSWRVSELIEKQRPYRTSWCFSRGKTETEILSNGDPIVASLVGMSYNWPLHQVPPSVRVRKASRRVKPVNAYSFLIDDIRLESNLDGK